MRSIIKAIFILTICIVAVGTEIAPTDPALWVTGAKYTHITPAGLEFLRFSPKVLSMSNNAVSFNTLKARTTPCATLNFTTSSITVQLRFKFNKADHIRKGVFIVNQNSEFYKKFEFVATAKQIVLDMQSTDPGMPVHYSIILPLFANPILTGISIDDDSVMAKAVSPTKKVYIAMGDSITHGVGQENSTQTYAYQLAEKFNMELFNLAVGGGKISIPAAESLRDWENIDLITILIGYNDLHFEGKTVKQYCAKYNEMVDAIRTEHPQTKVFCISPLYTRRAVSDKTGVAIQEFRNGLEQLIRSHRSKGDKNLFFIAGDKITTEKNLRAKDAPKDPVHLSIEGAALFADELYKAIKPILPMCICPADMGCLSSASNWLMTGPISSATSIRVVYVEKPPYLLPAGL